LSIDFGTHRRHLLGWIILAILAAVIVGGFLLFVIGFALGFIPFVAFYRPFFFFPFGLLIFLLFVFLIARIAFGGWWWGWGWRRRGYYRWADSKEILRQRYARGEITKEQLDEGIRAINESYSKDGHPS
jgi:uncharacterized membrane protein